jgi:acetaldehyde dehydrogenase
MSDKKIDVAIIGPGNIGTDLLYKILKRSKFMNVKLMVGIYENSEGLERARSLGVETTSDGIDGLKNYDSIKLAFDATSAAAHMKHAPVLKERGVVAVDLTPAAIGPYVCPVVNLEEHLEAENINLITCGGQATIPIVYAVSRVANVKYAEIVATIASKSAGPGTRQNIDEFTLTTAKGIEVVGHSDRGKAIIILNPAEPPIIMRNTIYTEIEGSVDIDKVKESIQHIISQIREYVPGYRIRFGPVQDGNRITTIIEVEGAGDFLPKFAGNLDVETSAAVAIGEQVAQRIIKAERITA